MKRLTPVPIMSVFSRPNLGLSNSRALRAKLLYKGSQIGIGRALQFDAGGPPSGQRFCSNGRPISSLFICESAVRVTRGIHGGIYASDFSQQTYRYPCFSC